MASPSCPVCGHSSKVFLIRRDVPVQQNFLFDNQNIARAACRGDLEMAACGQCGFVHNAAFDQGKVPYGSAYDNAQTFSTSFVEYLKELARYVVEQIPPGGNNIVEVGCGNGYFIRLLVQNDSSSRGYGFDPSYRGPSVGEGGRLRFESRYYDRSCAPITADVVICRHVIEHVKQPLELLTAIRDALVNSPNARIFLETPCVEWIFRNRVVWDFFYEHCSLFSAASLTTALEKTGFRAEKIRHVFGGQYLWAEGVVASPVGEAVRNPGALPTAARQYRAAERQVISDWTAKVRTLSEMGKVAVWGAGAKGVTFVNLVDPGRQWLDCVVDLNPNKQGHFVAGTGHAIVGYRELAPRGVAAAILMNPNYRGENRRLLEEAGITLELVEPGGEFAVL